MINRYLILIIGMSLVTIIPRILPLIFHQLKLPKMIEIWIKGIPYAALAALTIPGVFKLDPSNIYVGIIGFSFAVGASLLKLPLYITVFVSVLAVYLFYLVI